MVSKLFIQKLSLSQILLNDAHEISSSLGGFETTGSRK